MTGGDRIRRRPGIVWREEKPAPGVALLGPDDAAVTLIHDGMMHQLNPVAGWIWKLADGTRNGDEITAELQKLFDADPAELSADVAEFIGMLAEKGWIDRV
jgi:coenzyme PQQ biosynthesis protein PqqD